jgi:hypothetical protein
MQEGWQMKKSATVLLIIGLALGTMGGAMRVLTMVFGDTIVRAVQNSTGQLPGVRNATDRSAAHVLAIAGDLALVLVGGAAGIVVSTSRRKGVWRTILSGVVVASGIALLLLQSWMSAGAYIIGGFLVLVTGDLSEETEGTP